MPVRSRGSLLAGTATLAGLLAAGLGCHSNYSDHDSFSIHKTAAQPNWRAGDVSSLFGRQQGANAPRSPSLETASQPVVNYGPTPSSAPAALPVALQPAPVAQSAERPREVIASTWSPVQRVSAEQVVSGPSLQGSAPAVAAVPAMPARLPIGAPAQPGNGPNLDGSPASVPPKMGGTETGPPANIVLPSPRPLRPLSSASGGTGDLPVAAPSAHPFADAPREFEKMALPPYVVEPPDILLIQASDRVTLRLQRIQGQHLVAPDGTVNLGIYGRVRVAGMTLDQVADAVAARLLEIMPGMLHGLPDVDPETGKLRKDPKTGEVRDSEEIWKEEFQPKGFNPLELIKKELQVDVLIYNSKFYYVITDGGGYGQQVYPIPIKGNETVLDALANVNGLPAVASKKRVWVARATRPGQPPKILPVDWMAVAKCGQSATNYQLFPGDRVYVDSNHLIKADTFLSKLYSPILRSFGITLLGSATVNTIKTGGTSGISPFAFIR